jgi:porphobilinogen synthase
VNPEDLIWPVFVREETVSPHLKTFPGVTRFTTQELISALKKASDLGINSVMLFPVVEHHKRTPEATEAFNEDGILPQTVFAIKKELPHMGIITDVALDPYTSHGQDGLVIKGQIDNDETLKALERHALVQAKAGSDVIAPSEMMDGRIGCIRRVLDAAGYQNVSTISYAAKYASNFYGPFREALGSKDCLGLADKMTYQMDPANLNEALREVAQDIQEGTDMVIIKPGLPYLDVVRVVKDHFKIPVISFQISGEYAMLKLAGEHGFLDYEKTLFETMTCFKRAGADGIITYGALDVARLIAQHRKEKRHAR